jgi:hypothetical protein
MLQQLISLQMAKLLHLQQQQQQQRRLEQRQRQ